MQTYWNRIVRTVTELPTEERFVIGLVLLACMVACAIYVVRRVRGEINQPISTATDHLTEFRQMREKGALDDQEYNRVVQAISKTENRSAEPESAVEDQNPEA